MAEKTYAVLRTAAKAAEEFLESLSKRPVHATATLQSLRTSIGVELTEHGASSEAVLRDLVTAADPGIIASAGPRYFGFVIGGAVPVALAADWMVSAWDQNAGIYVASPAASVIEEVAGRWLLDLLRLPSEASFGFVTGAQLANFTCLAAARNSLLRRAGWDVEEKGLQGAPRMNIVTGEEVHITVLAALRMLGLGSGTSVRVAADDQGRMIASELERTLAGLDGPTLLCTQAGNVNSGAIDPFDEIIPIARRKGCWIHVDGAFGLWAAASDSLRPLVHGVADADSWAVDAHKWLNVPYDSGIAIVRERAALYGAFSVKASYLEQTEGAERDSIDWVPEFSRRARAVPVYAAIRQLGRGGVAALIDRCVAHAKQFASALAGTEGVEVLNEVVVNQLLVRFGDSDDLTRRVIRRVQDDGILWLGGTIWKDRAAMRISVSNWSTSEEDVRISIEAIISAWLAVQSEG